MNTIISNAQKAAIKLKSLSSFQKERFLVDIAQAVSANKAYLANLIVEEANKPIKYAIVEVERTIQVFKIAAEEAKRVPKEYLDLDWTPGKPREGFVKHFPIGPILGITPFNFPLNLVAHKVGPAIASGCPIVIKPSPKTPKIAIALIDLISKVSPIEFAVQVIEIPNEEVESWVKQDQFKLISFTGSPTVGWYLKSIAGKKKVALELGGNAGAIICRSTDVKKAAKRCVAGGYAYSGQVCIHTQRIYVHDELYDQFIAEFQNQLSQLFFGDLNDPKTDLGKMISTEAAERVETWIKEAEADGAKILAGGKRNDDFIEPTLITDTKPNMKVVCEEVFGPVVVVERFKDFEKTIDVINHSPFGLQAGVFTDSQKQIKYAFENLEVGGVMINEVPTYRADHMPYGGIKDSGFGREGVKYAIQEMTEPRILVI